MEVVGDRPRASVRHSPMIAPSAAWIEPIGARSPRGRDGDVASVELVNRWLTNSTLALRPGRDGPCGAALAVVANVPAPRDRGSRVLIASRDGTLTRR